MAFDTIKHKEFLLDSFEDSDGVEQDIPTILDTDLTTLSSGQRITFTVVVGILCILSVVGNVGTLYANHKRKVQIFFKTCLISLALSDLLTTLFMTVGYLAQFSAPYVQVWWLGGFMCGIIPFVTTAAILVSSMTLVGIALDRYFAVLKAVLGFWNPNKVFCIFYAMCVWGLCIGIASPMYSSYCTLQVFILTSGVDRNESTELVEVGLVQMCVSEKESTAYYYVVVLAIIFVPTLVAFVWLNSIIANKLWIRRHSVKAPPPVPAAQPTPTPTQLSTTSAPVGTRKLKEKQMEMIQQQYQHPCHCLGNNKICTSSIQTVPTSLAGTITTTTTTTKSLQPKNNLKINSVSDGGNSAKHISSREARHLRMFTIVLILMAVFIFFRLPAWIFLIMRMYGTYTRPVHWILHFSFGILTLTSCVLNPLLYTFLAETIHYAMFMKGKLCGLRRYFENCGLGGCYYCCLRCCRSFLNRDYKEKGKMSQNQNQHQNANQKDNSDDDDNNKNDESEDYSDGTSNDGAKSTSKKSDDDSRVYTIIPVLREVMQ